MRLDKYLSSSGYGSRAMVKSLVYGRAVTVNDEIIKNPDLKIDEDNDKIAVNGEVIEWKKERYYIIYKPAGIVTAITDKHDMTIMDILPEDLNQKNLIIAGRLDKDTEGLLLLTTDGKFSHWLLSPKHHVPKTYIVKLETEIADSDIAKLERGVNITDNQGQKMKTMPAIVKRINEQEIELTITEGKFHQIKKMAHAIKNEVIFLQRISFGNLQIGDMQPGDIIEIAKEDII